MVLKSPIKQSCRLMDLFGLEVPKTWCECGMYIHFHSDSGLSKCTINSMWQVVGHDHCMQSTHYVPLHHITTKFSLSTSFSTVCPSINEIVGLPGWSKVEHRELIQDISFRIYLSIR